MKINEIRSLDNENLSKKLDELRKELIKLNVQVSSGTTPKSPGQVKEIKKTIAKIKTVMRDKKLKEANKKG